MKEKFAEESFVLFTRILGLLWHYLKKILRIRILRRVRKIETLFCEQIWSCDQRNLIDGQSFHFFAEHAGKIPSMSPFCPSNRPFRPNSFASFVPIFGRPPYSARIPIKIEKEMNLSKFWIRNVTRILPIRKLFHKNFPPKRPFQLSTAMNLVRRNSFPKLSKP